MTMFEWIPVKTILGWLLEKIAGMRLTQEEQRLKQ